VQVDEGRVRTKLQHPSPPCAEGTESGAGALNKLVVCRESEQGTNLGSEWRSPGAPGSPGRHLAGPGLTRYRIASVAQDCRLLLWDFTVEETDFEDDLDFSTPAYAAPPPPPPGDFLLYPRAICGPCIRV